MLLATFPACVVVEKPALLHNM